MSLKRIILISSILFLLWFLYKKFIVGAYLAQQQGLAAAQTAAYETGYTTYNRQTYAGPLFAPILRFFSGGSYIPSAASVGSTGSTYSDVQG